VVCGREVAIERVWSSRDNSYPILYPYSYTLTPATLRSLEYRGVRPKFLRVSRVLVATEQDQEQQQHHGQEKGKTQRERCR